jgi:Fanconi anemia group M protein
MTERQSRLGDVRGPKAAEPFDVENGFVKHPYLVPNSVEARDYQINVATRALRQNTLVVLPTGLGKTVIGVLVIAETLRTRKGSVLLLAPTRPLSLQHAETLKRLLRDEGLIHHFSGELAPAKRQGLWGKGVLIVATPQTIRNDLAEGRYDLKDISLVIFDEAHRAVGDYAYVEIGLRLREENPTARILGLTASPGAEKARIQEVANSLGVEAVQAREHASDDVSPYVHDIVPEEAFVQLPPVMRSLQSEFQSILNEQEAKLRQHQVVQGQRNFGVTKRELVQIIRSRGRTRGAGAGPPNFGVMQIAQKALYAQICLEHLETQGLVPLQRYLQRMSEKGDDAKRMEKSFFNDERVQRVFDRLSKGIESSHPKVEVLVQRLRDLVAIKPDAIAIVFAQYRDTIASLQDALDAAGFRTGRLVGQQAKGEEKGQSQDQQRDVLARFARREFNVLLSTSIGEEGLDVPQVDLVVFYEAVPSEIRAVQRRGRTGRTLAGKVLLLITKDTRDEAFYRSQVAKEGKMRKLISRLT